MYCSNALTGPNDPQEVQVIRNSAETIPLSSLKLAMMYDQNLTENRQCSSVKLLLVRWNSNWAGQMTAAGGVRFD